MGAFDLTRPPEPDLIEDCVHCGFCLPTCPTYELWGEEMDSPRGRILLMRAGHEQAELSAAQVEAWDNCLGCMACVTACPSGVQYDRLIADTRAQVERGWRRPLVDRLHRRLLFALFAHPARMRALGLPLALGPVRSLAARLGASRAAARLPRAAALLRMAPPVSARDALARLPERTPAHAAARRGITVGFLQGCVQRVFFGDVNRATVAVLAADGFDVWAPRAPRCCGALQMHSGDDGPARDLARRTIAMFASCDVVVANAAGCGSAMKEYGHLLRDDPVWAERAEAFAAKVRDVTELLAEHEPRAPRRPVDLVAVHHDACHLAHAQAVRAAPRALLTSIPGVELREPENRERCCGSAGIYNLVKPGPAAELGRMKARDLLATGVRTIVAANPGCALQIAASARDLGEDVRVLHPVEVLYASVAGRAIG